MLLVTGHLLLVTCYWSLFTGYLLLVTGYLLLDEKLIELMVSRFQVNELVDQAVFFNPQSLRGVGPYGPSGPEAEIPNRKAGRLMVHQFKDKFF